MLADALLLSFCRRFEGLHGQSSITPNMHMHGHLTECIKDYGPLSSFWLFSFERFNGLLGDLPTNNRLIETQVMQRFVHDNFHLQLLSYTPIEADEVNDMFKKVIVDHAHSFQSMKYQPTSKLGALSACTSGFSTHRHTSIPWLPLVLHSSVLCCGCTAPCMSHYQPLMLKQSLEHTRKWDR